MMDCPLATHRPLCYFLWILAAEKVAPAAAA